MNRNLLSDEQVAEIVSIINTAGYIKATDLLTSKYGISYQTFKCQLRKESKYGYNRTAKQYYLIDAIEKPFMSIEELTYKRQISSIEPIVKKTSARESLFNELIQERLLEYHKFITFNREEKYVVINVAYLDDQGFKVEMH